ncbi:MAG: AAA family ATPase, partial [Candidatus Bathyarchaeota archaeon]
MNAHPRAEIKLVDRVKEIRLLKEAASRAINSHGSVLLLHGEAGIGKTKLARDLGTYAQSNNMLVLSGRCPALFKMDGVPPYVLWKELIRDYLDVSTTEQLYRVTGFYPIEVSKLVPELGQKLKMIPESFPLNPEHSRDRFYEAVSRFIINISRESPLLIILDDLQWADQSSLLLLNYLARSIYKESLLVLGAYRDTFVDEQHSLFPVLTELNRERLAQSIQLKRLSFDHISEMIQRILEQDDIPREFCKLVYQRTRGNPFFVEEVINSLKEREIIDYRQGKWHIKSVSKISFPRTIKNLIKARTSRLDDDNQHVLTLASFIGKDFTLKALQGVSGIKEDKLLEILENLLKTGLLECKTVGRENVCSFADIIVRDVLHEAISPLRSKKLHHSVGLALEKVYAKDINEHLGELSLHFLESGDNEKALDYSLKAGEKAAEVYANSEAASHLQHAYSLLETKQDQLLQKATVLEKLGDVKSLTGEHDACVTYWNKALSLWKQLDEKMKASAIHRKLANLLWEEIGDTDKAKDHHSKALEILEAEPKSTELASLYEDIAHMLYITGNMSEALSLAEKSLKLAQKLNALEAIASSSASLGAIYASSREFDRAIEYFENALGIALENGYWETASRTYTWLSIIASAEKHLEYAEKGYELAKRVGSIENISWMQTRLAGIHIGSGNLKEAISLAEESVAFDNKTGNFTNLSGSTGVL